MRYSAIVAVLMGVALIGCDAKREPKLTPQQKREAAMTPEQKAKQEEYRANLIEAKANAKKVNIDGKTFSVARISGKNNVFVDLDGAATYYNASDIEAAAKSATGCTGKFEPGIFVHIPKKDSKDIRTTDLSELKAMLSGNFPGWTVALSC